MFELLHYGNLAAQELFRSDPQLDDFYADGLAWVATGVPVDSHSPRKAFEVNPCPSGRDPGQYEYGGSDFRTDTERRYETTYGDLERCLLKQYSENSINWIQE